MKSRINLALMLSLGMWLSGCAEDLTPVMNTWKTIEGQWSDQIQTALKTQGDLKAKFAAITQNVPGKEMIAKTLSDLETSTTALQDTFSNAKNSIIDSMKQKKIVAVQEAINKAQVAFTTKYEELKTTLDKGAKLVGDAEVKAKEMIAAAAAEPNILDKSWWASHDTADFSSIDFKPGSSDFNFEKPASKETLEKLVSFAKMCPELKFELIGHTSREGDEKQNNKLSEKRAEAVKKYLVENGVEVKKIAKTYGKGSTETLATEPTPGSDEEKSMDATQLADARNKNRRIAVHVVTACK